MPLAIKSRSAEANRPNLLRGVDRRRPKARLYRETIDGLIEELGGPERLTESAKIQLRHVGFLRLQLEAMQTSLARGEQVDIQRLEGLSGALSRALGDLGLTHSEVV
jgi:hypothetical protein